MADKFRHKPPKWEEPEMTDYEADSPDPDDEDRVQENIGCLPTATPCNPNCAPPCSPSSCYPACNPQCRPACNPTCNPACRPTCNPTTCFPVCRPRFCQPRYCYPSCQPTCNPNTCYPKPNCKPQCLQR